MNELNFEAPDAGYPRNVSMMVPGEQSTRLADALSAVTQVLARYELIEHLAKTDDTIAPAKAVDSFCIAMLEANQEDLSRAIPGASSLIDRTYINQMAESYEACQKGATISYDLLRAEAKIAVHAVSHIKDDVIEAMDAMVRDIKVETPFEMDDRPGLEEEADLDFDRP